MEPRGDKTAEGPCPVACFARRGSERFYTAHLISAAPAGRFLKGISQQHPVQEGPSPAESASSPRCWSEEGSGTLRWRSVQVFIL